MPAGQREQFSIDAWVVGLRAMANAHAQAEEARLADVGRTLLQDIGQQLEAHVRSQEESIAGALRKYFDPNAGQVSERLRAFVDDQGSLARLLDRYVGARNSVLAETLAKQVGEQSVLFKKLSPTDSEGLIKALEAQLTPRWPAISATCSGRSTRWLRMAPSPVSSDG